MEAESSTRLLQTGEEAHHSFGQMFGHRTLVDWISDSGSVLRPNQKFPRQQGGAFEIEIETKQILSVNILIPYLFFAHILRSVGHQADIWKTSILNLIGKVLSGLWTFFSQRTHHAFGN